MPLTAEQILSADDLDLQEIYIPEWQGSVYLKPMTGAQRDRWERSLLDKDGKPNAMKNTRASLAVIVLCDEKGGRLFKDRRQIEQLGEKSAAALDRIFEAAKSTNRIAFDDEDFDDLVGNSSGDLIEDSGLNSPEH